MTDAEGRAMLRNAASLCIPPDLDRDTRDWIAAQPWDPSPRGWYVVGVLLDRWRYIVEVEPNAPRPALYVVAWDMATNAKAPGVFIERAP